MNQEHKSLLILSERAEFIANFSAILAKNHQLTFARSISEAMQTSEGLVFGIFVDWPLGQAFQSPKSAAELMAKLGFKLKSVPCTLIIAESQSEDALAKIFADPAAASWMCFQYPLNRYEILQAARVMGQQGREQRLERLLGMGRVARALGHQFANLLFKISGRAEIALSQEQAAARTLDSSTREHLQAILMATENGGVIVKRLQSIPKNRLELEPCLISEPLDSAFETVTAEFADAGIDWVKDVRSVPALQMDSQAIAHVFRALLTNAAESFEERKPSEAAAIKHIKVEVDTKDSDLWVKVSDNGPGIPAELLPRIFELAFTTKGNRGSGFGLTIAREIVEAHGGTLRLQSRLGKGTEAVVRMPGLPGSESI